MRIHVLLVVFVVGCTNASTKGDGSSKNDPDSGQGPDQTGINAASGDLGDSADGSSVADAARSDLGAADSGGGSPLTIAYREPAVIRGGACANAVDADACRSGSPQAIYCSLEDPTRVAMAACTSSSRGSQCDAMDDCAEGWRACTATDYVERGGRDVQPSFSPTNRAWLAACVQDAGGQTLRNEPCAPCTDFDPAYDPAVMWWCDDGDVVFEGGMDGDRLGVVTSPECFRVGQNAPSNGAWWALDFASSGPPFVMCCDESF